MLEYWLAHDKQRKHLDWLKTIKNQGKRVPSLENVPEVEEFCKIFWDGFDFLSERRIQTEVGPQPIQISEILAYVEYVGIFDSDTRDSFLRIVQHLDRTYINFKLKKRADAEKQARNKRKTAKPRR